MKTWIITALAFCAVCSSAFSQSAEFTASGGVSKISGKDIGSGYSLDDGFRMGFRLCLNPNKFFGHEVGYAYNRSHLLLSGVDQGGMAIHQGFYDFLVYGTPEGSHIRPFVAGGAHFSNFVPPGASATQGGGNTKFGVNYGAGIKVKVSYKFGVRADFRQYLTGKPFDLPGATGKLRQNEISVGFGLLL
jgi:opacity protein-like surface antigen